MTNEQVQRIKKAVIGLQNQLNASGVKLRSIKGKLGGLISSEAPIEDIRAQHPHLGLPRDTTIEKACGSWTAAVEQAAALVSRTLRLNFVAE